MNPRDTPPTFDAILEALMFEELEPDPEALERWTARYPEHREALVSYFATWAAQKELPVEVTVNEGRLGDRIAGRTHKA